MHEKFPFDLDGLQCQPLLLTGRSSSCIADHEMIHVKSQLTQDHQRFVSEVTDSDASQHHLTVRWISALVGVGSALNSESWESNEIMSQMLKAFRVGRPTKNLRNHEEPVALSCAMFRMRWCLGTAKSSI